MRRKGFTSTGDLQMAGTFYCLPSGLFLQTTSAGNQTRCNAGQKPEVVYIRIPQENRPALLPSLRGGGPVLQVLSYERR